jgi:organic radical activating enzyme
MNKKDSYTAANAFPIKVLKNNIIQDGKIKPFHIQLYPTNVCNLNCSFCSCANRNRSEELPLEDIKEIITQAKNCGCRAATLSGGGEPVLHKNINEILNFILGLDIKIGITSNGIALNRVNTEILNKITWLRISHSDLRSFDDKYKKHLSDIIQKCLDVDWSFSYVVTKEINYKTLINVINFANDHKMTHVRIVSDLLDLEEIISMDEIKNYLKSQNIDDSLVIYQGRKNYIHGTKKCLISLLKPVIGPDGKLYSCCGTQYSLSEPTLNCNEIMSMGDAKDLQKIYEDQKYFDGSICVKCYYSDYNIILDKLIEDIEHLEFL